MVWNMQQCVQLQPRNVSEPLGRFVVIYTSAPTLFTGRLLEEVDMCVENCSCATAAANQDWPVILHGLS